MQAKLNLSKKEFSFLETLTKERVPFMIVGMSAAVLQGAPLVTQDVDIWFKSIGDERIAKIIRALGGAYVAPIMSIQNPPQFVGTDFVLLDIVTGMSGLKSFDDEYKNAKTVDIGDLKIKILPLERVIKSKTAANRPKDRLVLNALKSALKINKSKKPLSKLPK